MTGSKPAAPAQGHSASQPGSTRKRVRSLSPKSSASASLVDPFRRSKSPVRTSPDTSFDILNYQQEQGERLSGEALEYQLREAARASAIKRRKRQDGNEHRVPYASTSATLDRTREWIDGVGRIARMDGEKVDASSVDKWPRVDIRWYTRQPATAQGRQPGFPTDTLVETAHRPAFDAADAVGPREFNGSPRLESQPHRGYRPPPPPVLTRHHAAPLSDRQAGRNDVPRVDTRPRRTWADDRWQKGSGSYRPEHDPVNVRGRGWGERGWHQTYSYGRERGGVNR